MHTGVFFDTQQQRETEPNQRTAEINDTSGTGDTGSIGKPIFSFIIFPLQTNSRAMYHTVFNRSYYSIQIASEHIK